MILVRAAAGFGKTTLMQQYAESCAAQQHATVWLRLDAGDNDLERLLVHLDAGLAALSLQQRSDHAAFVTAFSGTHLELGHPGAAVRRVPRLPAGNQRAGPAERTAVRRKAAQKRWHWAARAA